ncbi:MAG: intein-containing RctB family protein [Candidatus Omnitrophota bacterium]|nr:intein-containing RctB family protein [Candidatus Omnitrophota bacterium]
MFYDPTAAVELRQINMTIWNGPLEKIDAYRWRIPKSYMTGMRVDGIIYADDKMIEDVRTDKAAQQVADVATLPGILDHSLAMPDIHWGYGFPIGGVAATDIEAGGVISPGGVGFDINCLCNSLIINELGYSIEIKDYEMDFHERRLICMNFRKRKKDQTAIRMFLKQKPKKAVLNIVTETGRQVDATCDHPFYTKNGMVESGKLSIGDEVAVYPFEGVRYEEPPSDMLVDEDSIKNILKRFGKSTSGNAVTQTLNYLRSRNILPISYRSPQLPYLIKMLGYCIGDGTLNFIGKYKKGTVSFYGKEQDLLRIKDDIEKIGFKAELYSRHRHHKIKTSYETVEFDHHEFTLKAASNSFTALMIALGMPIGNKCRNPFDIPQWLFKAPLWQKRLFLAGFFGAEMSKPQTMTGHGYDFYCPTVSMNKTEENIVNGKRFLQGIGRMLFDFGVNTFDISERKEFVNDHGLVSYRLRLMISNITENILNLYTKVGFEYNEERTILANLAAGYLRLKKTVIEEKREAAAIAPVLAASGKWDRGQIFEYLHSPHVKDRFIERSLYQPRITEPRAWTDMPTFDDYRFVVEQNLGKCGMILERIKSISEIEYDGWVYDFTVAHDDHNFIANNFVVSNCGVRLVRTNLKESDVRPKLKELVYGLYNDIPAGVGSKGDIKVTGKDERKLLVEGSKWVVDHGYGRQEDLEYTEEHGAIKGADPDKVSDRAYERGKHQSGTLGSGNHFLEVQVIDEVYDEAAASVFGLEAGQVTMMLHSGSRGLGYQVCDEYSKSFIRCLSKYNIVVPDRQLACAPVNSPEGQAYLGAMKCAANYAWANRQCLMHLARGVFEKVLGMSPRDLGMDLIYDVAHNIAKIEKYDIGGKEKWLCVHRKGATRAFPPDHPELPAKYKKTGQPVIIPGDMGRNSYLLVGTKKAEETFYSTCHGAGRRLSRTAAIRACRGRSIAGELDKKGIVVMSSGRETLAEEAPEAYKDVNEVVDVVAGAGISKKVCRMRPLGVIKG